MKAGQTSSGCRTSWRARTSSRRGSSPTRACHPAGGDARSKRPGPPQAVIGAAAAGARAAGHADARCGQAPRRRRRRRGGELCPAAAYRCLVGAWCTSLNWLAHQFVCAAVVRGLHFRGAGARPPRANHTMVFLSRGGAGARPAWGGRARGCRWGLRGRMLGRIKPTRARTLTIERAAVLTQLKAALIEQQRARPGCLDGLLLHLDCGEP